MAATRTATVSPGIPWPVSQNWIMRCNMPAPGAMAARALVI
jgi:hypothetical protein